MYWLCLGSFFVTYTICDESLNICPDFIAKSVLFADISTWVAYFNSSILVTGDNGRSLASSSLFLVTSGDQIYNYVTYAGKIIKNI